MFSFKEWLFKEIGQVIEPDKPETIPITAVPSVGPDNLPPTARTNRIRKKALKLSQANKSLPDCLDTI